MRGVPLLLDGSTDRPTDRIFIACHDPLLFQERYAKMRPVASRYNIIQLGLCTFTKEKPGKGQGQEEQLVARPYNIYACARCRKRTKGRVHLPWYNRSYSERLLSWFGKVDQGVLDETTMLCNSFVRRKTRKPTPTFKQPFIHHHRVTPLSSMVHLNPLSAYEFDGHACSASVYHN